VGRGTQLKRFCALPLRDGECEMIVLLGRDPLARRVQQIASQPMQLGLAVPLVGRLDDLRGLSEAIQALHRLSKLGVGLGKHRERHGRTNDSSSTTTHCKSLREQLNAFLRLAERGQRASLVHRSPIRPKRKTVLLREGHHLLGVPLHVMRRVKNPFHPTRVGQRESQCVGMLKPAGVRHSSSAQIVNNSIKATRVSNCEGTNLVVYLRGSARMFCVSAFNETAQSGGGLRKLCGEIAGNCATRFREQRFVFGPEIS
jgi:hypothetical protein